MMLEKVADIIHFSAETMLRFCLPFIVLGFVLLIFTSAFWLYASAKVLLTGI